MSAQQSRLQRLEKKFRSLGIDTSRPGFYDHEDFKLAEARDPQFLENYAAYVQSLDYSQEYLQDAREKITSAARFMRRELEIDGRKGACIDASLVLGRMLDREGIWNCAILGALSVVFGKEFRLQPERLSPIMSHRNRARAGHVWLIAPPFRVVDVTVAYQNYNQDVQRHVPEIVLAETGTAIEPTVEDLVDPEVIDKFVAQFGTGRDAIERVQPGLQARIKQLGALAVVHGKTTLRYVPCGVTALDGDLEEARNLVLSGQLPAQLYAKFSAERA